MARRRKLWEKRDDETAKQYRAFEIYMMMPPEERSLVKAAQEYYKLENEESAKTCRSRLEYWSAHYDWMLRADAWDREVAARRQDAFLKGIGKGAERKGVNIEKMRSRLGQRFERLAELTDEMLDRYTPPAEDERDEGYVEPEVKLGEITAAMRVQLDIYRALEKHNRAEDDSEMRAGETPDQYADRLLSKSGRPGAKEGD